MRAVVLIVFLGSCALAQSNPPIFVASKSSFGSIPIVAVDSAKYGNTTSQNFSFPITVTAGDNRFMTVAVACWKSTQDSVATLQLGESAGRRNFTKIKTSHLTAGSTALDYWYISAPAVGIDTVLVGMAVAPGECSAAAVSYTGVHQSAPLGTFQFWQGESVVNDSIKVTVSSAANELVVSGLQTFYAPTGYGAGTTRVVAQHNTGDVTDVTAGKSTGAASVEVLYYVTTGDLGSANLVAVPLKPANP